MKYQTYPNYKPSGVEWLGDVPEHWCIVPTKRFFRLVTEPAPINNDLELLSVYTEIGVKPRKELEQKGNKASTTDSYWLVKKGDVIVNKLLAWMGAVGHSEYDGVTSPAYDVLRQTKEFNSRFYHYLFRNEIAQQEFKRWSRGIMEMRLRLYFEELGRIPMPFPPKEEIEIITKFLDHETAKIDTLIDKQQRLIALLKEKRQAVISHAVTKGLNPNAPMKPSGVEWLGDVPEHWEVKQAKYIANITRGAILRPVDAPEYFDENGEWAYLNISDATACDKYLYESKLRLSPLGSTKSARVYPDNVIITASATIGKAFINKIKVCVHDGFIPFCELKIDRNYLYHYLSNPFLYAAMGKSNTQKNIYLDEVKNMVVTVPPDDEQLKIVEYLESYSKTFDYLITKAESAIELMQERRTALISAAVTGKIDVRDWGD